MSPGHTGSAPSLVVEAAAAAAPTKAARFAAGARVGEKAGKSLLDWKESSLLDW
jgi:hypothetical protein